MSWHRPSWRRREPTMEETVYNTIRRYRELTPRGLCAALGDPPDVEELNPKIRGALNSLINKNYIREDGNGRERVYKVV